MQEINKFRNCFHFCERIEIQGFCLIFNGKTLYIITWKCITLITPKCGAHWLIQVGGGLKKLVFFLEVGVFFKLATFKLKSDTKANASYSMRTLTKICTFLKSLSLLKAISTYYKTLLSNRKCEDWGRK